MKIFCDLNDRVEKDVRVLGEVGKVNCQCSLRPRDRDHPLPLARHIVTGFPRAARGFLYLK